VEVSASAAKKPLNIQKRSRSLLTFATSIVGLHILQEVFFGQTALGSFASNLLQILCAAVATVASVRAVRRAKGFTRPFWILIALSFVAWIVADLGWMYYESYLHTSPPRESIFHFLVDVRSLVLAMALLLDQNEEERPHYLDVGSLLDGVQLFIIFSLIYLGWYHIFSLHENRVLSVLRSDQIEVSENFAVVVLATLQVMRAQTKELRKLYLGFLACFGSLALATSYTDYRELRTGREIPTGSWADLGWTIPFLLVAWWADGWKQQSEFYPSYGKRQSRLSMAFENTIYSAGPLIVLLQASELGHEWRKLSLPLLGVSILCFGLRLALSKFREADAASVLQGVNDSLRESEDRYRDLVENSEDLVCTHDLQGNLLSVNPAPARVLGYGVEELLKTPMRDVLVPEFRDRFDAYLDAIKTNGTAKGTICVLTKTGERRMWEYSNSLRTEGVRSPVVRGLAHDITDRKRAEKALRESECRMRLFVEHSPTAVALFDREMRYIQASRRWLDDYGLGDRELHGLSHYEVFPEIPEEWKEAHRRGLAGEVLQEEGDRFQRADGSVQFLRWQIHPWHEATGQIGGIAIFTEDITARKQAESALRSSEQRYRALFEKNIAGVALSDADGLVLECNDAWAQMLGYDCADEIRGRHASEFYFDVRDRAPLLEEMKRQGAFSSQEMQLRRKDGSSVWVLFNSILRTAEDGSIIRQATAIDITKRKRAEEARRSSEQRYRTLFEKSVAAVGILRMDGQIVDCNDAWARMFGYTKASECQESNAIKYYPDPGRREVLVDELRRSGAFVNREMELRRQDGTPVWVLLNSALFQNGEGEPIIQSTAFDITDHKEAEEAVRRNEERFRVALKDSPITVFNQDRDLRYTWIYNPQIYLDHDVLGKTDVEILGPKKAGALSELKKHVLRTGIAVRRDVALPQNGRSYVVDMTIEPLFDEKHEIVGITGASIDIARLRELADQLQESTERLTREKSYLKSEIRTELGFEEIIGQSSCLHEVLKKARVVAPTDSTVLLLGETGTGKELVARSVHELSTRHENTFVKLNCAAVPSGLLESELFGHEKGAFTGAVSQKVGRIELAHKGTLFLDEIGEMPLELQPKLLRVLQDREFERLGGVKTLRVDVRIIAATNRDLRQDVLDRKFREDLFYRLNVFPIELPPLRNRKEDIPLLVYHFVHKHSSKMGKHIEEVPNEVMRTLCKWNWPGNIRELENMIERMVIMTKGKTLAAPPADIQHEEDYAEDDLVEMEKEHIIRILRQTHGVLSGPEGAASRLGLKRTTLQSMMKRLGIEPSEYRGWGNGTY
jgi:PAS domain S-box-containing protein